MFDDPNVVLHCEKIDKIYPGTKALDQVSFDLLKGKVNVLIGENGAGKSTLMKMIAGIEQPSAGKMYMDGQEVYFKDTNAARAKGIGIIHQELSLFPNMTVYQNIFMGHEKKKGFFLDDKAHSEGAKKILQRLEHEIPPETMVGDLRVGQQQMVEIARNLNQDDLRVLIMDEPTSSLTAKEIDDLFRIIRKLRDEGRGIVYISHRLEELSHIVDRVTIMRDGQYITDGNFKDMDMDYIIKNALTPLNLPNKIRRRPLLLFRKTIFFLAKLDGLHKKCHILCKHPHRLLAFLIHLCLPFLTAVNTVPVLAGGHRHPGDGEILVQLIKGGGAAAPPGAGYAGTNLHGLIKGCAVKQPVQTGDQRGIGGGVIHRTGNHQTVGLLKLGGQLVYSIVKDALAGLGTGAAGHAAPDVPVSQDHRFHIDVILLENRFHFPQGHGGVAVGMGTAVEH